LLNSLDAIIATSNERNVSNFGPGQNRISWRPHSSTDLAYRTNHELWLASAPATIPLKRYLSPTVAEPRFPFDADGFGSANRFSAALSG
jgi:hypothetical protein